METAKTKVKDMEEDSMFTMTLQDQAISRWNWIEWSENMHGNLIFTILQSGYFYES